MQDTASEELQKKATQEKAESKSQKAGGGLNNALGKRKPMGLAGPTGVNKLANAIKRQKAP